MCTMESENIYNNLADVDLGEKINELQQENIGLLKHIKKLEDDVEKLCQEIIKMKKSKDNLSKNISELFNTAKREIDRKNRTIDELRSQLDDVLFKRKRNGFHHFNSLGEVKYEPSESSHRKENNDKEKDISNELRYSTKYETKTKSPIRYNRRPPSPLSPHNKHKHFSREPKQRWSPYRQRSHSGSSHRSKYTRRRSTSPGRHRSDWRRPHRRSPYQRPRSRPKEQPPNYFKRDNKYGHHVDNNKEFKKDYISNNENKNYSDNLERISSADSDLEPGEINIGKESKIEQTKRRDKYFIQDFEKLYSDSVYDMSIDISPFTKKKTKQETDNILQDLSSRTSQIHSHKKDLTPFKNENLQKNSTPKEYYNYTVKEVPSLKLSNENKFINNVGVNLTGNAPQLHLSKKDATKSNNENFQVFENSTPKILSDICERKMEQPKRRDEYFLQDIKKLYSDSVYDISIDISPFTKTETKKETDNILQDLSSRTSQIHSHKKDLTPFKNENLQKNSTPKEYYNYTVQEVPGLKLSNENKFINNVGVNLTGNAPQLHLYKKDATKSNNENFQVFENSTPKNCSDICARKMEQPKRRDEYFLQDIKKLYSDSVYDISIDISPFTKTETKKETDKSLQDLSSSHSHKKDLTTFKNENFQKNSTPKEYNNYAVKEVPSLKLSNENKCIDDVDVNLKKNALQLHLSKKDVTKSKKENFQVFENSTPKNCSDICVKHVTNQHNSLKNKLEEHFIRNVPQLHLSERDETAFKNNIFQMFEKFENTKTKTDVEDLQNMKHSEEVLFASSVPKNDNNLRIEVVNSQNDSQVNISTDSQQDCNSQTKQSVGRKRRRCILKIKE